MSDIHDIYRLSPLQAGILFQALYEPGTEAYISQSRYRLTGKLRVDLLRRVFDTAVAEHDILRTAIVWDGVPEPVQVVLRQSQLTWVELDWRGASVTVEQLDAFCRDDRAKGFDLHRPPLMRVHVLRTADDCAWLIWTWHHILLDGWSVAQLFADLLGGYQALVSERPLLFPARRRYRDYIEWLTHCDADRARAFWRQRLRGLHQATASPLPAERTMGSFAARLFHRDAEATGRITAAASQMHVTLNTLVLGASAIVLGAATNTTDVMFGTVTAGRPPELEGSDRILGLFINTLPARVNIAATASVAVWLQDVQARQADAREFGFLPLSEIRQCGDLPADQPLFNCILAFENFPAAQLERRGLQATAVRIDHRDGVSYTNYPLTISIGPGRVLEVRLSYRRDDRTDAHVDRLAAQLLAAMDAIAEDPRRDVAEIRRVVDGLPDHRAETRHQRVAAARARIMSRLASGPGNSPLA
jgi:hypothetical protein